MKTIKMPYNEYVDLKNKADDTMKKYKLVYRFDSHIYSRIPKIDRFKVPIKEDEAMNYANEKIKQLQKENHEVVINYILTTNISMFILDKIKSMKLF